MRFVSSGVQVAKFVLLKSVVRSRPLDFVGRLRYDESGIDATQAIGFCPGCNSLYPERGCVVLDQPQHVCTVGGGPEHWGFAWLARGSVALPCQPCPTSNFHSNIQVELDGGAPWVAQLILNTDFNMNTMTAQELNLEKAV
jgi:hypothetical protein